MTILGVDTSTRSCSVAIVSDEGLMAEITLDNDQTHARHVMEMVDRVLDMAGISLDQLDGFAVTRGPGSFTGLRIGLSTVKGLGQATGKPIVAVSSLEVLAKQVPPVPMPIVTIIDAFRNEVYLAAYRHERHGGEARMVPIIDEMVIAPEKIKPMLPDPAVFVGNGIASYLRVMVDPHTSHDIFAPNQLNTIRGATVAGLGLKQRTSKECDAIEIIPVYLRKSDAELNRR